MSEDAFNMSIRKFQKEVGVTSQREIEETPEPSGIGRFVVGALLAVALAAAFLYADGYFESDPLLLPTAGGPASPTDG